GIGAGAEGVTAPFEAGAEGLVVVDLAVERDHKRAVVARHRLRAGLGEVDDGEAAVGERGATVGSRPEPLAVRAALGHVVARTRECRGVHGGSVAGEDGGDATHTLAGTGDAARRPR